ncbi:MAG: hypothetical protein GEV28_15970 [Actinophytocola sp.]|uniref:hypothetical protein n=1 Tax=Actinophytocola sp. TaxID=1872138 RepID=UPI001326F759|nr:hypothetical protein [Actinophytocola sp.]MPZ81807.1 hypothetical protein [Actinophytocola sp.]
MTHPAGGIWRYEPNHDYVAHLDDVFRLGNAPRLAGMLLSLANPSNLTGAATPCYLDIPAIVVVAPNDGEFTSHEVTGSGQIEAEVHSILQGSARSDPQPDLSVEQFFYHADVLSGQDVGKVREHLGTKLDSLDLTDGGFVERAVTALDGARTGDATTSWTHLFDMFGVNSELWNQWTGQASGAANEEFGQVRLWFNKEASDGVFRQDALRNMSGILIKYSATIHGARMNLDNLMGELVDQVNEWNDKAGSGGSSGKWVALGDIKNLADSSGLGHVFKVIDAVGQAASSLTAEKKLTGDQVYQKLKSYLDAADTIVRDAVGEVDAMTTELERTLSNRIDEGVNIPVWDE